MQTANVANDNLRSYSIAGPGAPIVWYTPEQDAQGYTEVKAYGRAGSYVVELFMFSDTGQQQILVRRWMAAQVARLPG